MLLVWVTVKIIDDNLYLFFSGPARRPADMRIRTQWVGADCYQLERRRRGGGQESPSTSSDLSFCVYVVGCLVWVLLQAESFCCLPACQHRMMLVVGCVCLCMQVEATGGEQQHWERENDLASSTLTSSLRLWRSPPTVPQLLLLLDRV